MEEQKDISMVEEECICPICSDVAPNNEPHRVHYGARCCLGCRAFFRRIHQKDSVPDYKCKSNKDCIITPKSKQLCKKCRYEKCLAIGMNPKQVLSDDERKQRFKNLLKKIEEKQRQKPQTSFSCVSKRTRRANPQTSPVAKQVSGGHQRPRKILPKDALSQPPNNVDNTQVRTLAQQNGIRSCTVLALPRFNENEAMHRILIELNTVGNDSIQQGSREVENPDQFNDILDSFTISMLRVESNFHTNEILLHHLKVKTLPKTSLILHLGCIASALTEFARSIPAFRSLTSSTQRILLRNNVPLYIQYVLARYFNSPSGLEQLNWILEGQLSVTSIDVISSLNLVTFKDFNRLENLLPLIEAEIGYSEIGKILHEQFPFPQHCNGLVAYLLLFNIDESRGEIEWGNVQRVRDEFESTKCLLSNTFKDFQGGNLSDKVHMLISHLVAMKRIFDRCQISLNISDHTLIPDSIVEKFTSAEDIWLQIKLKKFNESFSSVPLPQKLIFCIINYSTDKTSFLFKEMTPTCVAIMKERIRLCQKIHPEFEHLSDSDQELLWARNQMSAIALGGLKVNSFQRGKDQLRFSMGYVDPEDPEWKSQQEGRGDLDNLDSAYIYNSDLNFGRLDEASSLFVKELLGELSHLFERDTIYQLLTILTLIDTTGIPHKQSLEPIFRLRQVLLKLFYRKVTLSPHQDINIDYFEFAKTLGKIQKFGLIVMKMLAT